MTQTAHGVEFTQQPSATPKSAEERAAILANPGFGNYFTDHTAVVDYSVDENGKGGWHDARIEAYGPISLDPSAAVLHYGQEIFEGLKAYRHADGSIWTFRPEANAARLNKSARRLALPELPEEYFLGAIRELVQADKEWVPAGDGEALYLRPFMIATEAFLGVRAAREVSFRVIASPAGNYFGGELKPVSIWISREYARAGRGGTGAAKCGGNYAASLIAQQEAEAHGCKQVLFLDQFNDNAVEELGGMNVFFVMKDGSLVTPALTGTILEGVTRMSVIQVAKDMGRDRHRAQDHPGRMARRRRLRRDHRGLRLRHRGRHHPHRCPQGRHGVHRLRGREGRGDHHGHPRAAPRHPDRHRRGHPRLADPPRLSPSD